MMKYIILIFLCISSALSLSLSSDSELTPEEVLSPPEIQHTVYVDGVHGDDDHDGHSEDAAFKTLKHAIQTVSPKTRIYVMSGEYRNNDFGQGLDNGALMHIKETFSCCRHDDHVDVAGHTRHPPHQLRGPGAGPQV